MRPRSGFAYVELARSLRHQRRFDDAEAELLRALDDADATDANSQHYLKSLGEVLIHRDDPVKDATTIAHLRSQIPTDPEFWMLDARLHQYRGEAAEAAASLQKAVELGLSPERIVDFSKTRAEPTVPEGEEDNSPESFAVDRGGPGPGVYVEASFEKPWRDIAIPPSVTSVRSMLAYEEQQYLTWLTAEKFENWGAIVELGCWIGASSVALAEGLRRRELSGPVQSLDLFRWEEYMEDVAHEGLNPGDDFLPLYMRETTEYSNWIRPQKQDLMHYTWKGGPIEILFVDSAKTWELTSAVLRGFGRHLVPGRSRVVLQDFMYPWSHCLPLIFYSRPDLWREVECVENGHTVTFVPLKPLTGAAGIHDEYSEDAFPLATADYLLRCQMRLATPYNRHRLLKILYRKYLIDGPLDEAAKLREELVNAGAGEEELAICEDAAAFILPRGWKAFQEGNFEAALATANRCIALFGRSVHWLTLLGFTQLRLGNRPQAEDCMTEVLSLMPGFPPAKLFRSEVAISDGRYDAAECEGLEVLRSKPDDETTIQWSLNLLTQAKQLQGPAHGIKDTLAGLAGMLSYSPAFLVHFAREYFAAGQRDEARQTIEKALELAPEHNLAKQLHAEWGAAMSSRNEPASTIAPKPLNAS
jgi:tetratricopeptide (TPR) repeat protein